MRKPVQSSSVSHLTPAEQLIQAINKLNTKFEQPLTALSGCTEVAGAGAGQQAATHSVLDTALLNRSGDQALVRLRQGLIGHCLEVQTPFGMKTILYADWAASGRLLWQVLTSHLNLKNAVLRTLSWTPFVRQPISDA